MRRLSFLLTLGVGMYSPQDSLNVINRYSYIRYVYTIVKLIVKKCRRYDTDSCSPSQPLIINNSEGGGIVERYARFV